MTGTVLKEKMSNTLIYMKKILLSIGLIGAMCLMVQGQTRTEGGPDLSRVGVDVTEQVSISLKDAIGKAIENNNDIDSERLGRRIADFSLKGARGGFDPMLLSDSFYESRSIPTASIIGGARNGLVTVETLNSNIGISGLTGLFGGRYSALFNSARTDTSNQNATLNPQFPTSVALSYTQPLLAGRFDSATRNLRIAKKNVELSDSEFKLKAVDVVSQVEQAYWDLVFSLRNLQVQIDALKQARLQLESNQRLVEKGVIAPIEIIAANAQISNLEQNVFSAQTGVTASENRLKSLILSDRGDSMWSKAIVPADAVDLEIPRIPLNEALRLAFENRQELVQLVVAGDINKINEDYFRNQTRPRIDLTGSYTGSGLAGSTTPQSINPSTGELRIPENLIGGYRTSLGNLFGNDYPTYRVGLTISIPFRNRQAGADLGRTLVEADILRNTQEQLEQAIEADVRNSLQNLLSAEARLKAATASRVSAEQLYESEQRQFRAGTTTVYLVFQRQNDLVLARGREVQAQTDLNKAISNLRRAIGTTLTSNGIEVK
jgi:HAE1 family hydrophobic/amphiphilic exporter-1